jgi:hypothetical protein
MPFSKPVVLNAFDPATTVRNVIRVSTISSILIIIATCVSVGILVGTGKISAFTQSETILIYQSNMSLVLNRQKTDPINYGYTNPLNNNATLKNFTITLNETLQEAFPDSFLYVVCSPLSTLWAYENCTSIYRYTSAAKAFFKTTHISNDIKDALEVFHPTVITFDNGSYTISVPTIFNRVLSNVTDTRLTNLTLADLSSLVITNGSTAFL